MWLVEKSDEMPDTDDGKEQSGPRQPLSSENEPRQAVAVALASPIPQMGMRALLDTRWVNQYLSPLKRNAITSLAASMLGQTALAVTGILGARMLGPTNRGYLALISLVPFVLSQLGTLGLPLAITYFVARDRSTGADVFRSIVRPAITQCTGLSLVQVVVLVLLLHDVPTPIKLAASLVVIVLPFMVVHEYGLAFLQGQGRYHAFNALRSSPYVLYAILMIAVFLLGADRIHVVLAVWVIASVSAAILTVNAARLGIQKKCTQLEAPTLPVMYAFGLKALLGSVGPLEALRLDQLLIGVLLPPHQLGLYVAAAAVSYFPRVLVQGIGFIAYPHIASTSNAAAQWRSTRRFLLWTVLMAGSVALLLAAAAPVIIPSFFGPEFSSAVVTARILLIGSTMLGVRRILGDCVRGMGSALDNTVAEVASSLCLVPALIVIAPRWGIEGVALGFTGAAAFGLMILLTLTARDRKGRSAKPSEFEEPLDG